MLSSAYAQRRRGERPRLPRVLPFLLLIRFIFDVTASVARLRLLAYVVITSARLPRDAARAARGAAYPLLLVHIRAGDRDARSAPLLTRDSMPSSPRMPVACKMIEAAFSFQPRLRDVVYACV